MEKMFSVVVITDGEYSWSKNFDNALDAVNCYNKFVDHGTCVSERIVTLVEPNGKTHTKIFKYPMATALH